MQYQTKELNPNILGDPGVGQPSTQQREKVLLQDPRNLSHEGKQTLKQL